MPIKLQTFLLLTMPKNTQVLKSVFAPPHLPRFFIPVQKLKKKKTKTILETQIGHTLIHMKQFHFLSYNNMRFLVCLFLWPMSVSSSFPITLYEAVTKAA